MSLVTYSYKILELLKKKLYRQRLMLAEFVRCMSQVRALVKFESRVKFESGSVSSVFFFPLASFLSLSKAVIVNFTFITMCQLMFEALNMTEILLSTRSRGFIQLVAN